MKLLILLILSFLIFGCSSTNISDTHKRLFYQTRIKWNEIDTVSIVLIENQIDREQLYVPAYGLSSHFTFDIIKEKDSVNICLSNDSLKYQEIFNGQLQNGSYSFVFVKNQNKTSIGYIKRTIGNQTNIQKVVFDY